MHNIYAELQGYYMSSKCEFPLQLNMGKWIFNYDVANTHRIPLTFSIFAASYKVTYEIQIPVLGTNKYTCEILIILLEVRVISH